MTRAPALWLATLAVLALPALLAVGCGESEKEKYEQRVEEIRQRLEREFIQVGRDIQGSGGLENAAAEIDRGAELLERTAADLDELDPPGDAERAHGRIVAGVERLAGDFRTAAEAARGDRRGPVLDLFGNVEASEGARMIAAARRELERKGYDVGE